jgi:hypothetical protein
VIELIDKHRKNCLWRGRDFRNKGYNLAAWDLVRMPKKKGGLGVINLTIQNDALLLKQLDKFYKENLQWVNLIWQKYYPSSVPHLAREKGSFWWKDILRLHIRYRGIAVCSPGIGDTVGFREDLINGHLHADLFPNLLAFAKDSCVSLSKIKNAENLLDFFRLPMSRQAYNEFLELQHYLANIALSSENEKDSWSFIWGQQKYSSSKYYNFQFSSIQPNRTVVWIWETKCVPKIKFFAWLLLNDRLNTRNILKRRNKVLEDGYNCVLCHEEVEETLVHLFFDCPSATCRWLALGINWATNSNVHQKIYIARQAFVEPFFMEIFLIGAWCIWNERNDLIFNKKQPSLASWKDSFKLLVYNHFCRIKSNFHFSLLSWLSTI